jgi:hypothetical protein
MAGLPTLADSFREKRCLISTTGIYERRKAGTKKMPHHFQLKAGSVMGFAGLWSIWKAEGQKPIYLLRYHGPRERAGESVPRPDACDTRPADYAAWFDWESELPCSLARGAI